MTKFTWNGISKYSFKKCICYKLLPIFIENAIFYVNTRSYFKSISKEKKGLNLTSIQD